MEGTCDCFDQEELLAVTEKVRGLLGDNWERILTAVARSQDETCNVSIGIKLDHATPYKRNYEVTLAYAVRMKDKASGTLMDPDGDLFAPTVEGEIVDIQAEEENESARLQLTGPADEAPETGQCAGFVEGADLEHGTEEDDE